MIETISRDITAKDGRQLTVGTYCLSSTRPDRLSQVVDEVALPYATDFWTGAWQELLKDERGKQFGAYDAQGKIWPETEALMRANRINLMDPNWPFLAWQLANQEEIFDENGDPLRPYWTLDEARQEIKAAVTAIDQGGFEGEMMDLRYGKRIVGFTAYTVAEGDLGYQLAQQRFTYDQLVVNGSVQDLTLAELLRQRYPDGNLGVFLDCAVSETERGRGIGSQLFDLRLQRMIDLGADIIVGRTTQLSPSQYRGNYLKRGMEPIAFDPKDQNKTILAVRAGDIVPRR
jgi:GNAT superfamily N-acetyltransferase